MEGMLFEPVESPYEDKVNLTEESFVRVQLAPPIFSEHPWPHLF